MNFSSISAAQRLDTGMKKAAPEGATVQNEHSPSNLPGEIRVHAVNVLKPPLTCSTSCSFRLRAPWRINTLFWLFMFFSPFVLGSVERPQARQKKFFPAERLYIGAALAVEGVSVQVGIRRTGGGAKG
jgi:hypothetical protein